MNHSSEERPQDVPVTPAPPASTKPRDDAETKDPVASAEPPAKPADPAPEANVEEAVASEPEPDRIEVSPEPGPADEVAEEPAAADEPAVAEEPVAAEEPAAADEPAVTEEPVAAEKVEAGEPDPTAAAASVEMESDGEPLPVESVAVASTVAAGVVTGSSAETEESEESDRAEMAAALAATPKAVEPKPGQRMKVKIVRIGKQDTFVDFGGRSEGTIATSELRAKPRKKKKEKPAAKAAPDDATAEAAPETPATATSAETAPESPATEEAAPTAATAAESAPTEVSPDTSPEVQEETPSEAPAEPEAPTGTESSPPEPATPPPTAVETADEAPSSDVKEAKGSATEKAEPAAPPEPPKLLHKEGDEITVVVKSVGDPVVFTLGRKPMSPSIRKLKEAFENKIPVPGHVRATNKGGFEVGLPGARAFCPFSQVELGYCEKPDQYVGKRFPFQIITFERNGKNIVVSRRKLLMKEAQEAAKETRGRLAVDEVFEGVVRRLQPYGAFVDIGGIDGLVHVSQIRHGHVGDPREVLEIGEKVQVKILKVEDPGTKKERISLSMKDLVPDPWDAVESQLPPGQVTTGKVVRLTEFGAFVELMPGVDGLIHISEIAEERIGHPSEVLQVGQEVQPRVLSIDRTAQRISLSLREQREAPPRRPRGPREPEFVEREKDETHYRAEEQPKKSDVDVTQMEYSDALEILKRKFNRGR